MNLVENFVIVLVSFVDSVLPAFNLPLEFLIKLDESMVVFIDLLEGASFFIPLDIFVYCMITMLIIDNFTLIFRLGSWILRLVRG